ncbi:MAG: hypothetical protein E4H26_02310 [Flavobacteriales bacterium]|nr:MAG: hypothetical protein E4H26_02310 [Flavobacteriales bacterium]
MKNILFLILIIFGHTTFAQAVSLLNDYTLGEVSVVVFPFGMEYPVKIGRVSDSGELFLQTPSKLEIDIPADIKEMSMTDLNSSIYFKCDDPLGMSDVKVIYAGPIALWTKDDQYAGVLMPVSDEALVPWVEDPMSNEPIKASFFQLVYVETDIELVYDATCKSTLNTGSGDLVSDYLLDLSLVNGFNWIEYDLESLISYQHEGFYDPNTMETSVLPNRVNITSVRPDSAKMKWVAKYF